MWEIVQKLTQPENHHCQENSRLYTSWKFPTSKIGPDVLSGKKLWFCSCIGFYHLKQHQSECRTSKHGKSFAVAQQAQDTGTILPQAAGWPEDVLVLHQWPVLHPAGPAKHSFRKPFLYRCLHTQLVCAVFPTVFLRVGKHFWEVKMIMFFISFDRRYPGIQESLAAGV